MKEISQAVVEGDKISSETLYFYPKKIVSGTYKAECHTAASITLMTQSLIPTLIYGNKTSQITLQVLFSSYLKTSFFSGRNLGFKISTKFFCN